MNFATQLLEKSNVFSQAGAASLSPTAHRINNNRYANTKLAVTGAKIGAQLGSKLRGKKNSR